MEDLIKALQILLPYVDEYGKQYPTTCEHDVLYVNCLDLTNMEASTVRELAKLGFMPGLGDDDYDTVKDALGEDFAMSGDYENITDEQWALIKDDIYGAFFSYHFGSN